MNRLILDLIDKTSNGYIVRYCTIDNMKYGVMYLPTKIYSWFNSAPIESSNTYKVKYDTDTKITVTKELLSNNCYMKIEFADNVLYIPNSEFNKIAKSYCFQTFVDIKVLDDNGQLEYHDYKFLKNYDTRSKAVYFIDKFSEKFKLFYNKWFIHDKITYDIVNKALELFSNGLIYEHEYVFKNKYENGIVLYTFMIISVEKG